MQKMKFITQRKWAGFQPPQQFCYCCGAKKIYEDDYQNDGYGFIEWETPAEELPIEKIKLLSLAPSKAQLKKAVFPKFISDLTNLEHVLFDLNFLENGEIKKLPASVRSIILSRSLIYPDLWEKLIEDKIEWDESVRLESLESLLIIADEEKNGITNKISQENFPKLGYLGFGFSNKDELNLFRRFSSLSDLELSHLRDYPIFEHIEHLPIFSLDIIGANNKFDLSGVKNLKTLNFLRLNGLRSEIDCRIFTEIPNLKELVVLNSKKILNIEALLECEKLASINFLDCGNPFKKGIAEKFHSRNYEILDIKYA